MKNKLADEHSIGKRLIFRFKTNVFVVKRSVKNVFSPIRRFKTTDNLVNQPIVAISESDLWNPNDNNENRILTAGKIENLRIACRRINGLEVKANHVFSFWKHIGNPNFGKGYVVGREIREGCVVPTIAGGLCQLSNALYDAALKANFEIVERHRHTRVIQGSLAEKNRDATVKWNYVDLRFKSDHDFRIETELTQNQLIIRFRSKYHSEKVQDELVSSVLADQLNDCYSCGNTSCSKHQGNAPVMQQAITTFILDEKWPEHDEYIQSIAQKSDCFVVPFPKKIASKIQRYHWHSATNKSKSTLKKSVLRMVKLKYFSKGKNLFQQTISLDRAIAQTIGKKIPIDCTHLVISQNLLPFLDELGTTGGRTFDVLMTRLPFHEIHSRLNNAHGIYPQSSTLNDFRAPESLVELESKALKKARKIITTHTEIEKLFQNKAIKLDWKLPTIKQSEKTGSKVLFPASALGRKGAYAMKKIVEELDISICILGNASENDGFWETSPVKKFDGNYNSVSLVIFPAYIEHQPRQVLKLIAMGIPVIISSACGIEAQKGVTVFQTGDYEALKECVKKQLRIE